MAKAYLEKYRQMTRFIIACIIFVSISLTTVQAQNPFYSNGVSFKSLFMDYQSQNGGNLTEFRAYHRGFELGFMKNLTRNINLVVPAKIGVVNSHNQDGSNSFHKTIYGLDAQLQYQFFKPEARVVPYMMGGLGAVAESKGDFNLQVPIGAGLFFKVEENAYINWQSEYRVAFADDRNNLHHALGFVYLIGKKGKKDEMPKKEMMPVKDPLSVQDADGDGIPDDLDLCPQSAGSKALNGCPDKDNDGIADYKDACPNTPGLMNFNGCPDSDGDGISDKEDQCPNMAGVLSNNGCPDNDTDNDGVPNNLDRCPNMAGSPSNGGCPVNDRDNDGVPDDQDKCPSVYGSASTGGCPDSDGDGITDADDKCPNQAGISVYNGCPDTDGDGLDDSRDRCPNSYGSVANNGCPEIDKADKDLLELAMRAVQFDTGRATLKSESNRILNQIADIMNKYPDYKLKIEGHTDNTGSSSANQSLSERRSRSCYEYLIRRGLPASRLDYAGYGESRPISNNNTLRGRALNRRVEFNLTPR